MQRKLDSQINCQIIILDSSIKSISAKINTRYHSKTLGTGHNLKVVNLWSCIMSMSFDRRPLPALVGAAQNRNSWWLDTFETSSETYPVPNHIRIKAFATIWYMIGKGRLFLQWGSHNFSCIQPYAFETSSGTYKTQNHLFTKTLFFLQNLILSFRLDLILFLKALGGLFE